MSFPVPFVNFIQNPDSKQLCFVIHCDILKKYEDGSQFMKHVRRVDAGDTVTAPYKDAFYDNPVQNELYIIGNPTEIAMEIVDHTVKVYCRKGGTAEAWALKSGHNVVYIAVPVAPSN